LGAGGESPGWNLSWLGPVKKPYLSALFLFGFVALALTGMRDKLSDSQPPAEAAIAPPKTVEAKKPPRPMPMGDPETTGRSAYLRKEDDGHFWTTAYVDGVPVRFMVDTGASVIALTKRDALRIGLNLSDMPRSVEMSTANGRVRVASTVLDEVVIDRVKAKDVTAVVIEDGLETSLLGMSFLNQMREWKAGPRAITIRQ
jgi:aspartyl protease family protein